MERTGVSIIPLGKKNIDEKIEKLFEEVQDDFVGDFRTQINILKMSDEDKELLDDCLHELVEEWLIKNQSNYCIATGYPPYQIPSNLEHGNN